MPRFLVINLTLMLFCCSLSPKAAAAKRALPPDFLQAAEKLKRSNDPVELATAATFLCSFECCSVDALTILTPFLSDPQTWERLDSREAYKRGESFLRIRPILLAVGRMGTPEAEGLLMKLANQPNFAGERVRVDALIEAMTYIRSPSSALLKYLEGHLGSLYAYRISLAFGALARMSTAESCATLEAAMLAPKNGPEAKMYWPIKFMLPERHDPEILQLYKRLIHNNAIEARLRNRLVQSLFDYRPDEWYGDSAGYYRKPPPREHASPATLKELLVIANLSLKQELTKETRDGVLKAVKEIEELSRKAEQVKPEEGAGLPLPGGFVALGGLGILLGLVFLLMRRG